jgi:hypothetical protein
MGLLDDAIREHLELKRRRGADPGDLERAEQEALGPVRREPFSQHEAEFDRHAEHDDAGLAYDREPESRAPVSVADDEGVHVGGGEGPSGLSEAEYEEYYDEEYYDEEEDEWERPDQQEAFEQPRYGAAAEPSSADPSPTASTGAHRASVPPESAPPTQAARPHASEEEQEGEETVEYSVEEAMRPGTRDVRGGPEHDREHPEPPGEDVLEETPEFLQDAPEHDRLWFEQRPPRDFDFDG